MVFESMVVDLLNRYLKPYVKKLDTSQLKVGVWKGQASLDKLELKEDLFAEANLDVPLSIKRSHIGKLEMQIPWKRLTKDPLVIIVDEVYVIIGPNIETTYDKDKELENERKHKENRIEKYLEAILKKRKIEKEAKKGKKKKKDKDSEKPDTFVEKLAVHLTKNLQVLVRDIHVRYEDSITKPGMTLSAGVTLHSLEVKSTDSNWVPHVVRETATVIYKLLQLNCLGLYWNSCDQSMIPLETDVMIEEMRNNIARPAVAPPPSNAYLLNPMTATAKLKLNVKIDGDLSMPQLVGGIDCGDILFSLKQEQLKAVLMTVEYFERYKVNQKYLKYKPTLPLKEDKKGWWRYAITAILEEDVKRRTRMWSWKHMKEHRSLCKRYQGKYEKLRSHSVVSSALKEEVQRLEDQLHWFNIMLCRELASSKKKLKPQSSDPLPKPKDQPKGVSGSDPAPQTQPLAKDQPKGASGSDPPPQTQRLTVFSTGSKEAKREEKARKEEMKARKNEEKAAKTKTKKPDFFSKLKTRLKTSSKDKKGKEGISLAKEKAGLGEGDPGEDGATGEREETFEVEGFVDVFEVVDEEEAREQLYKDIGYVENAELKIPKEYIGHEVHLNINSFTLELIGKKIKVGNLVTERIGVDLYHRPATHAVSVSASVGSMVMMGIPLEGRPTTLITSLVGAAKERQSDLVKLQLEISPIERPEMDVTVKAALNPIQIIYDFDTVNSLIEMFKPPKLIHFHELTQAASASLKDLKSQTSDKLKKAVQDRKQIELDISLKSPYIVVPEKGHYKSDVNLIVVDLGQLSVRGQTTNKKFTALNSRDEDLDSFYDTFGIKLDGMQVLVAKPGEDWRAAMTGIGSSPLHILDSTGLEIVLFKSIVENDAYLPSVRVEGTLPGFEIVISDTKLASLVKVASTLQKPPALITVTDAYDALPTLPKSSLELDSVNAIASQYDTLSISTIASSTFEEDDEEGEESSLSLSLMSQEILQDKTAKQVFTDVAIKLNVKQVALKLTQTVKDSSVQKPLLDVIIRDIKADVVDRKWDTQGSVSIGEVAVKDYITVDSDGQPTYLLKTQSLTDGNFISAKFVTITQVGRDFAAKYTGLQDSVSAQLSLIKVNLNRETLASVLEFAIKIVPTLKMSSESPPPASSSTNMIDGGGDGDDSGKDLLSDSGLIVKGDNQLNPDDLSGGGSKKALDLHFDVKFDGINTSLLQKEEEIIHTSVTGFSINGRVRSEVITVDVNIRDVSVVDTSFGAETSSIISKADKTKDIMIFKLLQYNHTSYERVPDRTDWVDTSVSAEIGRVLVNISTHFLTNVLDFATNLNINKELFQSAAVATAETATVTATAIAESTKTAHRVKMDVVLHAPAIHFPYSSDKEEGGIFIDLGDFKLSNRFIHAHELESEYHHVEVIPIIGGKTLMDCIQIETTSIQIHRSARPSSCSLGNSGGCGSAETRNVILEPVQFVVNINRNISRPSEEFPNVGITLNMDTIKFHLHENDIQAMLTIGQTAKGIVSVLNPPSSKGGRATKERSLTLVPTKGKRSSTLFTGFNTSRPRSTTATNRWQKAARLKRHMTHDGKEVTDVRISASLKSVFLDFTTINAPLFEFTVSDLNTRINVFKSKLDIFGSVDSLSLIDLGVEAAHSKVVSLAEHTDKVSSIDLTVSLDKDLGPMAPLGSIKTNIAQVRLVVMTPFVLNMIKFVQRLELDLDALKDASKVAAQGGATVVSTMAHEKYFKIEVGVHAPVLILPVGEHSDQGLMVDLGSLAIRNTLLIPDQSQVRVGIDAYGIKLDSFKVSRVLFDVSKPDYQVVSERVLLQPFHMLLALERNLCSWYNKIPSLSVNLNMGELTILLGQEDLEQIYTFGMRVVSDITPLLPNKPLPSLATTPEEEEEDSPQHALPSSNIQEEDGSIPFEKFRVMSSMPQFELRLFKSEPHLSPDHEVSKDLSQCVEFGLASLKLVTMELKVQVSSANEVEVEASMKDIAFCDDQKETQKRNTGNRVVQHYTSNPLKAFTGKIENPLITIKYLLRQDQEHNIIVSAHDLLILSDVEFLSLVANYFKAIFEPPSKTKDATTTTTSETDVFEETLKDPEQEGTAKNEIKKTKAALSLPKMKFQVSVSNFRVAIIEDVFTEQPQALTLRLSSSHVHLQLGDSHKHASLSLLELSIASSSFFDLDNTTSWVLLPFSMQISMTGPPNSLAMEISGSVDPICLMLSPPVVRLTIHAIQTLIPKKEHKVEEPPRDLWMKQFIGSKFWFLESAHLNKPLPITSSISSNEKLGEVLTLSIESVEIILENEDASKSSTYPVLALNASAVIQAYDWTGPLAVTGEARVEATYYNQNLSLWEPLIETLERKGERQEVWDMQMKVTKAPPKAIPTPEGDFSPKPDFSLELSSESPLQLTLTRTSLLMVKNLAEAYSREYGKQAGSCVEVQTLTGSPFTVYNKLGKGSSLFVQPGPSLKISDKEFTKLDNDESVDLIMVKRTQKKSSTSLIAKRQSDEASIDIVVGKSFRQLKSIMVDTPGIFYYTLVPKENYDGTMSTYGLVVEVSVTGAKKTILIRSPIQFKNHLQQDLDIVSLGPSKDDAEKVISVLKPDTTYYVPIEVAETHTFHVTPTGFGFTPVGKRISWQNRKDSQHMDLKSVMEGDDTVCFFSRVIFQEEKYKLKRNVQKDIDYPHHIFHIHPPLILQNYLPYQVFFEAMRFGYPSRSLDPGQSIPIHELDIKQNPEINLSVIQDKSVGLKGKFTIDMKQPEYAHFPTLSNGGTPTQLSLHTEDLGYFKIGLYCAFWMINKTGLTLEYKEGNKITKHPKEKDMVLLSTSSNTSKIQLRGMTQNNSFTDWTKHFAVNAVGTGGNFSAKLGENHYRFGVEISFSQFTLTKMVMVTPYYLLVNKTKRQLAVHEMYNKGLKTALPPGEVIPFWTLVDSNKMVLIAGEGEKGSSLPFNYKKTDNIVLQFDNSNEVLSVCVEVQESESATVITFSPYYRGSIPLLVINHFSDVSLRFAQTVKDGAVTHVLSPRESLYFTWDNPLARKAISWDFPAAKVQNRKTIDVTKDCEGKFSMTFDQSATDGCVSSSISQRQDSSNSWIEVDESFTEQIAIIDEDTSSITGSITSELSSVTSSTATSLLNTGSNKFRGYWKSFIDGLQRTLVFTPDEGVLMRIKASNSFSVPIFEASLSLKAIGLSLVDNDRRRELAYISISPSGVIWQLDKGKRKKVIWKTLNNSVIAILEEAYQGKKTDIKRKDLSVNFETMEMFTPLKGKLRRTYYEGVNVKATMSEKDFALQAKIGYLQVDNQLPFSVYPQVAYPLPPPPTVASTAEPKPFIEASIILKKPDQSNVIHFKYVHVLVQKVSVNADLGFILSLVDFFSFGGKDLLLEAENVKNDIEYAHKSLMQTVVPELADDISTTRIFFDVLHLSPIKINLSFNIRGSGKNKKDNEVSVGDHFIHLFLDSIGVILTSVQDIEMKFSLFHLEYQPQTGKGLTSLLKKHYRNQALFELHTLIFGLDVLGNPVSVVRGVVIGAKDLFYEPFKGSVLGPEEFFEGLGIGLKSFFGAGVVGGLTGAGARITGAFGDVFAKLTFDEEFIDQRQQTKAKPPKMGWKLGGFAKNVFEGVTGVVVQPVKGLQKEGAVGLLKGTGKGLVGLLVRPTGGLVDLASGTLDFVTRKTKVGNFEISDVRPPRFIGRDGVIRAYCAVKAVGAALLVSVDEGSFVESDYYVGHIQTIAKPVNFLLVTDRRMLLIERKLLTEGWTAFKNVEFKTFESPVQIKDTTVLINYSKEYKERKFRNMTFKSETVSTEIGSLINHGYIDYFLKEQ